MNNLNNSHYSSPQPEVRSRHNRQVWWQILLPMILGAVIIIALAVLVGVASNAQVTRFSDISIIFLILPTAATGLVFLIIFGALIYGVSRLIGILPHYADLAQQFLHRITAAIKSAADKAAKPVITADSVWAGARVIFRRQS